MFAFSILPVVLAASTFAMPAALTARQDPCSALGEGATGSLAYDFRLAAVGVSGEGVWSTTKLALLQGADDNWMLRTWENNTGIFPSWKLQHGELIPNTGPGSDGLVGTDFAVSPASIVEFGVTNNGSGNANGGHTPYCVLPDASGNTTLAANNNTQGFSICETPDLEWVVVYEPSSDNNGAYDVTTCSSQQVQLIAP
ncbi:uncharacterized protein B0H18DRAFT_219731 [Fomitopsis serialis]|uniref:uncharacterized protein n=1 Tax=Fomitopsis serialis TaxID=139415 RepID=UPI002008CEF5|nr:uncharacterized protein B0H18DRAFT_219731 [Neoantrodia serialis]KAH9929149.1 hypothetical protein B0H18DRAFT_219731 [Neoantrodia serialis]